MNAVCPQDVITISDGTTVEVLNTDAEGRLILADALVWAITKRKMMIMIPSTNIKPIRRVDFILIPVGRDIPEHNLVSLSYRVPLEIEVALGRASHVCNRRLITDDL